MYMHACMCNRHICPLLLSCPHFNCSENPKTGRVFPLWHGVWESKFDSFQSSHKHRWCVAFFFLIPKLLLVKNIFKVQFHSISGCMSNMNSEGKDHFVCYWAKHQLIGHLSAELSPRFRN